jgi:hypothetical protein
MNCVPIKFPLIAIYVIEKYLVLELAVCGPGPETTCEGGRDDVRTPAILLQTE